MVLSQKWQKWSNKTTHIWFNNFKIWKKYEHRLKYEEKVFFTFAPKLLFTGPDRDRGKNACGTKKKVYSSKPRILLALQISSSHKIHYFFYRDVFYSSRRNETSLRGKGCARMKKISHRVTKKSPIQLQRSLARFLFFARVELANLRPMDSELKEERTMLPALKAS